MEKASFMNKSVELMRLMNTLKKNNVLTNDAISSIVTAYQNGNVTPIKNLIYSLDDRYALIKRNLENLI